MARSKLGKGKLRKKVFGGMFIISLIVIMVSISFSWYYTNKRATGSEFMIEVPEAQNLVIKRPSEGDEGWSKKLQMNFEESSVLEGLKAVNGNGENFYKAKYALETIKEGSSVYDYVASGYEKMTKEQISAEVFSFEFSFYIENELPLYFSPGSEIRPSESAKQSIYGDFSTGNISGAMRAALFQKETDPATSTEKYVLKCVWIPDTSTQLIKSEDGVFSVNSDGTVEDGYMFVSPSGSGYVKNIIETNGEFSGSQTVNGVEYIWGDITQNHQIGTLKEKAQNDFKVVIWVDGADRECHNALLSGAVYVNLKFGVE